MIRTTMRSARLRIAWVEEWMSSLASHVLPGLAQDIDITYVTAGATVPDAPFQRVVRGVPRKHMNVAGFELSRHVNRLYRDGAIDLAVTWASIGFALGRVPFVNIEGGSVYREILLFGARTPALRRLRFVPGFFHYAVPEILCNRRARKVVVPSEALKRDLMSLHRLPDQRVDVVPHGVEPRHLGIYERKRGWRRPTIVFVGRLHYRKGIAALVGEFVRRPEIQADFLIVGDGPDGPVIAAAAARDPRLRLLGSVDRARLESILLETNIFVFPTYYEGFGLALTEAMASGHACVAYDIPVVREVLDGAGRLVPVGQPGALLDAVAELVREPPRIADLSRQAHGRARRFSWDEAVASFHGILGGLAGLRPGGSAS
jgi:glycosyltransferase involved in cell wall biosynthesis